MSENPILWILECCVSMACFTKCCTQQVYVSTCATNDFVLIFQQDGAPFHTRPSRKMWSFIHQKALLSSSESGCNPKDYTIRDFFKEEVYRDRAEKFTEQELKDAIVQSWEQITRTDQIWSCLSSCKKRLRLVCDADGGNFVHLL
mgnify:FL=1